MFSKSIASVNYPPGGYDGLAVYNVDPRLPSTYKPTSYKDEVRQSRFFYRYDPLASTCINRMVDIAITDVKNKRLSCNDEEMAYFNGILPKFSHILTTLALEYYIAGMGVPDFGTTSIMGNRMNPKLGRKRYVVPDPVWVRNTDDIVLKKEAGGIKRSVYIRISGEEAYFIQNNGKKFDGTEDVKLYESILRQFPDYVRMVKAGVVEIPLPSAQPVLRKILPNAIYPQAFLVPALDPMKHKLRLKQMDYSLATKAIEAVRLVNVGSDDFPIVEGDDTIEQVESQLRTKPSSYESIFTLVTNHTVKMQWVFPPLDALLSENKYSEPNADIIMAMGFSRVLMVGESLRSNAGQQGKENLIGSLSALQDARSQILSWVTYLYEQMADKNGFRNIPKPYFSPINYVDVNTLGSTLLAAVDKKYISKSTFNSMLGFDYESEQEQMDNEPEDAVVPTAAPVAQKPTPQKASEE